MAVLYDMDMIFFFIHSFDLDIYNLHDENKLKPILLNGYS